MKKAEILFRILVSLYSIFFIIHHFLYPGLNIEYTKALLLNCILLPAFAFPFILTLGLDSGAAKNSNTTKLSIAPAIVVVSISILIILIASIATLGFTGGLWYLLYSYPFLVGLASRKDPNSRILEIAKLILFYFFSFFSAIGIVILLQSLSINLDAQTEHFNLVWPGYLDGLIVMMAICIFGILNQASSVLYSLRDLRKYNNS